jgi:hypothetical protein
MKSTQKKFLEVLLSNGGFIGQAAKAAGIHRTTHLYWMKTDLKYKQKFEEVYLEATEELLDEIECKLVEKAREGAQWAVTFFLKAKGRKRGYSFKDEPAPEKKPEDEKPPTIWVHSQEDAEIVQAIISEARQGEPAPPGSVAIYPNGVQPNSGFN